MQSDIKVYQAELELAIDAPITYSDLLRKLGGRFDRKTGTWRILPYKLFDLLEKVSNATTSFKLNFEMNNRLASRIKRNYELRDYQQEAVDELEKRNWRGIIVLPTGAGKTLIGIDAIYQLQKKTLIVVPTIDLMNQWAKKISDFLGISRADIAFYGGGKKFVGDITITTYASAKTKDFMKLAMLRYGLVIFDEAHHLTGELNREIAKRLVAPFRIGLTATPGGKEEVALLEDLVGKVIKVSGFSELIQKGHLSPFDYEKIFIKLTEEEREEYENLMIIYLNFVKRYKIDDEIERFRRLLIDSTRNIEARRAVIARLRAKRLALNAKRKFDVLAELLERHKNDKVIIFARHQNTARKISVMFGIPYIVGDMSKNERKEILDMFKKGIITKIATAEVLDEGIDIPSANVGIILSGKPSKRQLIQRIGRVLRPGKGKRAKIYEIITSGTYDYFAYRKRKLRKDEL